ncbi:hypothetical protein ACH4TI_15040 [Streptomyces rochei]|uniref:hypothetical protein n=1 Tax=Streptomyces rochei TaxID=1928 RepID=UPI0037A8C7F1
MAGFPLDMLTELNIDGVWTKVPTYERDTVVVEHGSPDRASQTDPGQLTITINNRDGRFSPRNPMSPYYGKIGRNSLIRLSVPNEESFLQLDGDPAAYASTPDAAALDLTMDLDLRWEGEADWYATAPQRLIGKWGEPGGRSYLMRIEAGALYFYGGRDGTVGPFMAQWLPALPRRAALRVTLTGGAIVRHYWAPTMDGPWTQLGTDVTLPNPLTNGLFVSTTPLLIAPAPAAAGRTYRAEVRGAGGTVVASPDFRTQAAGAAGFTDAAGRAWTLAGGAEIRDRHDLFVGEVSEWPQKWTPDGADAWVPLVASGILRRMGQGRKALGSALRRRIPSFAPMAYWPMEEGEAATKAYSPLPGGDSLTLTNVQWAGDDSLLSSSPLPTINAAEGANAFMFGPVRNTSWASLPAWSVIWMYRMPQVPPNRRTYMMIYTTGTVRQWYIQMGPDNSRLLGLGYEGETLVDRTIATSQDIFGVWVKARFAVEQDGSNVRYTMVWSDVGGDAGAYTNTVAGTSGRPTGVASPPGGYHPDINGMALGHISVWDSANPAAYDNAIVGWTGEDAGPRMMRLAQEEGLPLATIRGNQRSEQVGQQTVQTLLTLLQEAADADGGLLLEDRRRPGLVYRERSSMYSQTPRLVLSYDQAPGLAAPLDPVDDDTTVRNDRTVKRAGGSEGRAVLEEGPLSVAEPPDGIGLYDDSVTLSLHSDAQTEPIAYWRLALGTVDGPRYPTVTILLHKAPHLIPQVLAMMEGDLVRITDLPAYVGFGDVDLLVDGIHHEMRMMQWTVTLNCSPAEPWQVGVVGDAVLGRVDTDGSQLAAAVDADDTLLPVTVTAGPLWVSAGTVLNSNADFAASLAGWTGFGAAIERVAAPKPAPFDGAWALQLTPDGAAEFPNAGAEQIPIVPGQQYTVSGWLRCATARSVALNLNWFDATGAYLDTAANDQPVTAGTWTWFEMTATAPAGAASANLAPTVADFPPPTDVLWAHHVTLRPQVNGSHVSDFPFDVNVGGEVVTVRSITPTVTDRFERTVAAGWGAAETGNTWALNGGVPADYKVETGAGQHLMSTKGVYRVSYLPDVQLPDVDLRVAVSLPSSPTGDGVYVYALARGDVAAGTFYFARLYFGTTGTVQLSLRKRTPAEEVLGTAATTMPFVAGRSYHVRLQVEGTTLRAKAWPATGSEPAAWTLTATDTSIAAAGTVGLRTYTSAANTNTVPVVVVFDDLQVMPQHFRVVRSVNGVVKSHTPGTAVRLAHPTRLAL